MAERVLLICYYFPPQGGAGVGRPLALYKHLPKHGIECDILTVKPVAYRLNEPELLDGLDTSRIYRAGSLDPQRLMYLLGIRTVKDATISKSRKITDRYFPDPKVGWVRPAVKLGRVLSTNRHYGAVISTSPPMSSHLVGMKLSKEFRLPLIADFRDFWTGYKVEDWFEDQRKVKRARDLLKKITDEADRVITVNPAISDYLGKGAVIYNSYDENRARLWGLPERRDHFIIGILGTLEARLPLEPLLKVLESLRKEKPAFFDKIRVVHVGSVNTEEAESLLRRYDLETRLDFLGVRPREETIKILSETSLLYLGFCESYRASLLPGRLFDMLVSGRPILAATAEDGVTGSILRQGGVSCTFDDQRLDTAVDFLGEQVEAYARGETVCKPNAEYARRFSSEKMAESFARVVKNV
ncbi:MAG: hypothetical protein JSV52_07310 [Candidatus Zixiibacteriota bacterium]|nr:MAG: hypothetical protein JSV52_07310 [candidate division Zixibacteria bacterium]